MKPLSKRHLTQFRIGFMAAQVTEKSYPYTLAPVFNKHSSYDDRLQIAAFRLPHT